MPLEPGLRSEVCCFWGLDGGGFPTERLCVAGFHRRDATRCLSLGSRKLLDLQSSKGMHVATGGLPVFIRMDHERGEAEQAPPAEGGCRWRAAHEAAAFLGTRARRRTLRLPPGVLHEALTRRSRHALSMDELRELERERTGNEAPPAATAEGGLLERCLHPDGSLEEGGVVVGVRPLAESGGLGEGSREAEWTRGEAMDRLWLSARVSERDGLVLLAEGDVLRRSAELLALWCEVEDGAKLG